MTEPLLLNGLRGDSPAAALALYGIAALLDSTECECCWTAEPAGGWRAMLLAPGVNSTEDLADRLAKGIQQDSLTGLLDIAPDANKVMPEDLRRALDQPPSAARTTLAGLVAECPVRAAGQTAFSRFTITSFQGKRSVFGTVIREDDQVSTELLHEVLVGPWLHRPGHNTLNLDPSARDQDGSRLGVDPSTSGVRGVGALLPLMIRGVSSVPPHPAAARRVRCAAFADDTFVWPIWSRPLPVHAISRMASRDWSKRSEPQRRAASVEAVFGAKVTMAKDGRRLTYGRRMP